VGYRQSGEAYGDGVRAFGFEVQKPKHDYACEGEYWTDLRWILLIPYWRIEARVEEGFRAQETAERCAVAMPQDWLYKKHNPGLVLIRWGRHLLPGLPVSVRELLYAVHWLFEPENQQLRVLPKLWKEVHVDGCTLFDYSSVMKSFS